MTSKFISILFLLAAQCPLALAHPPGLSSADLIVKPDVIDAKITFAAQDIEAFVPMDKDQDAEVSDDEMDAAVQRIVRFIVSEMIVLGNGKPIKAKTSNIVKFDKQNNVKIELYYPTTSLTALGFQSKILEKFPEDHKQYVTVKDINGKELAKKMLTRSSNMLEINLNNIKAAESTTVESHSSSTFLDFLKLGIEHILTGYDHLLFLFSLLVVTRSFWPAIKIITFFTIAHSITLALAGLNIVNVPSNIIEPLIAATIVYVGLENIIKKDKVTTFQRCILTFVFGLIHGFGFAGVLREMGISSIETGILVPLFSFNLGVETGQIAVASIVLPLVWWLHKSEKISRYLVPVGSILTCLAGGYWLLERTVLS